MKTKLGYWGVYLLLVMVFLLAGCNPSPDPEPTPLPAEETLPMAQLERKLPTASPPATLVPAPTLLSEPGPTQAPTATPFVYPESFYIRNIAGHSQNWALSCEASAAMDWAAFFGYEVYESTFQAELPHSDNPNLGYVGNPATRGWGQIPPYAYGVHADPVAALLQSYGIPARSVSGYSLEEVKAKLAESKPIIAWIIGNMEYSEPVTYIDKAGNEAIVAPYEHVVILTGYNAESIRYMSNGKFYDTPTEVFLTSWGVLGNMAVIHE